MMESAVPLRYRTPRSWAKIALSDTAALLSDHAYLERKAASNALEMLNRWPEPGRPRRWVPTLAGIARDETLHLEQVTRLLEKRGAHIERLHKSDYASQLRALVRTGRGKEEIMDRLLVSALIEARSYERFDILAEECEERDMASLYKGLKMSERGHYRAFLALAGSTAPAATVKQRWNWMLDREAEIAEQQQPGPRLHSGVPR